MRTSIILAGWLIGQPDTGTGWLIFGIGLAICVFADAVQTDWLNLKNKR